MSDFSDGDHMGQDGKHGQARALAEASLRARSYGDTDRADALLEQARRTDPAAVEDLLLELEPGSLASTWDEPTATDREVELMMRTLQPHSDAPSRSGITGSGSGADGQ